MSEQVERIKTLIIGSGPAGYTAAIYASRADLKPVMYTGLEPGGQLTTTTEVDNFPGYPEGIDGPTMMMQLQQQAERFGTEVRIGMVTAVELSDEENDAYFHSRPKESQVAALASQQSRPIDSRDVLESHYQALLKEYADTEVPRPRHWGGYRVIPDTFEFWQGGKHRLHDRYQYTRDGDGWRITRLQP